MCSKIIQASPLRKVVETSVNDYFECLDDQPACNVYDMVISEVESALIALILNKVNHNQSAAANILGISRGTLRKKIHTYNL